MAKDIVYFDLETQRSFKAVGGAKNKSQMGISVGVAFSTAQQKYLIYDDSNASDLGELLLKADLVVGYNHIDFDYPVLQGYVLNEMAPQTVNLDMMVYLEEKIGYRPKLDLVAEATLGAKKSADGIEALKWWQEHKKTGSFDPVMKIAEYCCFDVKVTMRVHEFGVENGYVCYFDKSGELCKVEVSW
ncbi:ribonuclease H-like domain-containing protein [Akkermansiaceae bacterium]|nr:ribonuclease H-like domain-containing protein [Akkermansiaceae bacterium]